MKFISFAVLFLLIAGCGGGSSSTIPHMEPPVPSPPDAPSPPTDDQMEPPVPSPPTDDQVVEARAENLEFPLEAWNDSWYDASRNITWYPAAFGTQHYGASHVPNQSPEAALNSPVYHDSGHFGGLGLEAPARRLFVGIDHGTGHDLSNLPVVQHHGEFDIRFGQEVDGAGENALSSYLDSAQATRRFEQPPTLRIIGPQASLADVERAVRAAQIVNAALPIGSRIRISASTPSTHSGFTNAVGPSGSYSPTGDEEGGTIYLEIVSPQSFHGTYPVVGRTWSFDANGGGAASYIQVVDNAGLAGETSGDEVDRRVTMLMAHEIIHALGIDGHVTPWLDSIMTEENTDAIISDGTNQPLSILYPADREALRVLYSGADYHSLGSWSATSTHLHGNGRHTAFGVVLRNGYTEPWAYGFLPPVDLQDNSALMGTVSWNGRMLGFAGEQVVAGAAEIRVSMSSLSGSAAFTQLEQWPDAPKSAGSGVTWGDGDLHYRISIDGNTFIQSGGDDGLLTGIFTGDSHQGAAGTLERNDLTAAFGATRE